MEEKNDDRNDSGDISEEEYDIEMNENENQYYDFNAED